MKYIKFDEEILQVPENVYFWIMHAGDEYSLPYYVNMSYLATKNFMGKMKTENTIKSETYKTREEANDRLDEILELLNK